MALIGQGLQLEFSPDRMPVCGQQPEKGFARPRELVIKDPLEHADGVGVKA
jgi:hypothetical protein